jgi:hypothetical protein
MSSPRFVENGIVHHHVKTRGWLTWPDNSMSVEPHIRTLYKSYVHLGGGHRHDNCTVRHVLLLIESTCYNACSSHKISLNISFASALEIAKALLIPAYDRLSAAPWWVLPGLLNKNSKFFATGTDLKALRLKSPW